MGVVSAESTAKRILQMHTAGLRARRDRDLCSEKYLLHIDGSGDFQWADIFDGERVAIPRLVSEFRKTENILRLVVDNAVAYHTSMPLQYQTEVTSDRRSRDQALVDTLFANHLVLKQDLNSLFGDALYMAMAAGFCPVHRYWRDDMGYSAPEPVSGEGHSPIEQIERLIDPRPGMIDCWVGNPFDHVFDRAARRGSVYWSSYGRVLPAQLVRDTFDHIPGVSELQGTTRMPSVSIFQRIARNWQSENLGLHGSPVVNERQSFDDGEELLTVVCQEIMPGVSREFPAGRLQIIIVPESVDLRRGNTNSSPAVLVVDQDLPAGDYSWTLFYSHHRGDDVLGKPWVEDIDQEQVDLNIAISKRWEVLQRMIEAPIVAPGGALDEDMTDIGAYQLLEVEPSLAGWRPRVMEWPSGILEGLQREIDDRRKAIYTGGGFQASSRGEAPGSRMAYRAIVALQQADTSIHGPVNLRFQRAAADHMRGCWMQAKAYMDVPWLTEIAGDEYEHLVDAYIDNSKLSVRPPTYKVVNAFGPSPEMRAQEVMELMAARGADGEPFLTTAEARRLYPNQGVFNRAGDTKSIARRRAKTIATRAHDLARELRQKSGFQETAMNHPAVQQAAMIVFAQMEQQYTRMRDDDLESHLAAYSEVTQDETADPIARLAIVQRQNLYYEWQAEMAQMAAPVEGSGGSAGQPSGGRISDVDRRGVANEMAGGAAPTQSALPAMASR